MVIVGFNKKKIEAPESWNELDKDQLLKVARIYFSKEFLEWLDVYNAAVKAEDFEKLKSLEEAGDRFRFRFLSILLKLSKRWYLQWLFAKHFVLLTKKIKEKDADAIAYKFTALESLMKLTDFLFSENNLTKNLIPDFSIYFKKYYGPSDGMKNISAGEFAFSDMFFLRWIKHRKEKYLDVLIACLYRSFYVSPSHINYEGDVRAPFSQHTIESREIVFGQLSSDVKYAILLWYWGCRNEIVKNNQSIFCGDDNERKARNSGWFGIFASLAENDPTRIDTVSRVKLLTLLATIKEIQARQEEMKQQLSKR